MKKDISMIGLLDNWIARLLDFQKKHMDYYVLTFHF